MHIQVRRRITALAVVHLCLAVIWFTALCRYHSDLKNFIHALVVHLALIVSFHGVVFLGAAWIGSVAAIVSGIFLAQWMVVFTAQSIGLAAWGGTAHLKLLWDPGRHLITGPAGAMAFIGIVLFIFACATVLPRLLERGNFLPRRQIEVAAITVSLLIVAVQLGLRPGTHRIKRDLMVSFYNGSTQALHGDFLPFSIEEAALAKAYHGRRPPGRPKHVVIIVIDALRADHTSVYGYGRPTTPGLEALVRDEKFSVVPYAVSNCCSTNCGVWSILCSRRLASLRVNNFCLHDVLRDAGYETRFIVSGVHLGWFEMEKLYRYTLNEVRERRSDLEALKVLEQLKVDPGKPQFLYLHYSATHSTEITEPQFRKWSPLAQRELLDPLRSLTRFVDQYDSATLKADWLIQQSLEILRSKGIVDPFVAILSDHGERLGEDGRYGHSRNVDAPDIRIPLLFSNGGKAYPTVSFLADQTDVATTIAAAVGVEAPHWWEGIDLKSHGRTETTVEAFVHPWNRHMTNHVKFDGQTLIFTIRELDSAGKQSKATKTNPVVSVRTT